MNLNEIGLTPQLIADLYADSLVEIKATSLPDFEVLKHLGGNHKQVSIVIRNENAVFLTDEELSFLTNILNACKLTLADVAVVNTVGASQSLIQQTLEQLKPAFVLLFGVEPPDIGLPMNFPAFQLQPFNKRIYLCSPSFMDLMHDREAKKKLWEGLKRMFGNNEQGTRNGE